MRGRRAVPATELRVHLGEALRGLDREDIVVEKGGVPVALITKYEGVMDMATAAASTAWSKAVVKTAEPGGWARAEAAMARGFSGIGEDELVERVLRARVEGSKDSAVVLDDDGPDEDIEYRPRSGPTSRVAEERGEYRA